MVSAMSFSGFSNRQEASRAAADLMADRLFDRLKQPGRAAMIVSGGTTPAQCFNALRGVDLDWSRVDVALTDERDVSVCHEASNERMVREILMQGAASAATFLPCGDESIASLVASPACCLVGMGEDGHFASIFPDNAALDVLLDPAEPPGYLPVTTTASEFGRVTANLSLLLLSPLIVLLVFGIEKRRLLEAPRAYPILRLISQTKTPVEIFWSA
jgi:6-phosphogluconolactonase